MTSRRARRVDALHRRWPSSPPTSVEADGNAVAPPALDVNTDYNIHDNSKSDLEHFGRRAGDKPTRGRSPPRGDAFCMGGQRNFVRLQHRQQQQQQQWLAVANGVGVDDADEGHPDIPTDDFQMYMAALVEGIRADGAELASTAREAVANTFQVVVRPLEAVARLAAPFLQQQPIISGESSQSGQVQVDDVLAFRMPGSLRERTQGSPFAPVVAAANNVPGAEDIKDVGALRSVYGNSPPRRSTSPGSRSLSRSRGAVMNKDGNGWQKLGAVKLALTPPGLNRQENRRRVSCSPRPSRAGDTSSRECSPTASPRGGASGHGSRRVSISTSPCQNNGGVSSIISPIIGDRDENNGVHGRSPIADLFNSPRRTPESDPRNTSARAGTAGGDVVCTLNRIRRESNSSCRSVVEGSRLDLRALDSIKTGKADRPKVYECTDGSIVVLGRERMVSVRPEQRFVGGTGGDGKSGGGARYARDSGVVTWVVRFGEMESCCVNVSAGKGAQRCVGDVVFEVTTRPDTGSAHGTKPLKRRFCLRNPSDCLELLRSMQARWQPPPSPSNSGNKTATLSSTVSQGDAQAACTPRRGGGADENNSAFAGDDGCEKSQGLRNEGQLPPERTHDLLAFSPGEKGVDLGNDENKGRDGDGCGDGGGDMPEMSPFRGLKKGVAVLESPAKSLREQLRERHEEHEKGLKEHLESKARASKVNLQRRRDHRRSISQGPAGVHRLSCNPASVPQSPAQPQKVARAEGLNGAESCGAGSGDLDEGTSVGSESSTSEHAPVLAANKKVLKNGVPEGAVHQKMVKDGRADDASIAAVFSASTLEAIPPPPPLPLQLPMPPPLCRVGVSSSVETNPSPEVYSKLLKDCIPASEVRQKVSIDSVPTGSTEALFHEGDENGGSSSSGGGTSGPIPTPPPLMSASLLPVASRGRMLPPPPAPPLPSPKRPASRVGFAGGDLTVFAGGGRLNPQLASPPPCSPPGSSRDRRRGFFGGGGAGTMTVTPPYTPSRRRTSVPLLNLHWDVLPASAIEKTVWGRTKAKGTSKGDSACPLEIVDDEEVGELEKLFSKREASAMSPRATPRGVGYGDCGIGSPGVAGAQSAGSKSSRAFFGDGFEAVAVGGRMKKVQLLDVGRGNNVAIGLKSFKMAGGVTELADVIRRLDPDGILTVEDLQRLEACLPTRPELKHVLAYDGPAEALGPAESFFRALAPTPRPANKVSVMLFALQFPSIAEVTGTRLETLRMACQETTSSDRLARVLERVLVIGNLLNEGTYKGNACGFRLASLLKLSHTKSHADNKTTVLRYIVRSLGAKVKAKEKAIAEAAAAAAAAAAVVDEPAASSNTHVETAETCAFSTLSPSSETGENAQLPPSPMSLAFTTSESNIPTGSTSAARQGKSTNSNLPRSRHHHRTSSNMSVTSDSATPVKNTASTKKPSPAGGSAWTRGAPPGCVRAASSTFLSDRNHRKVTVGGPTAASRRVSAVSVSPHGRGNATAGSAAGGRAWGSGGKNPSGDGRGHGRGRTSVGGTGRPSAGGEPGAGRGERTVKVEMLDLEAELGHLREASKIPIGEIMMDVRQAKRGLKQAKDELQLVLAENKRPAAAVAPDDLRNVGETENRKGRVEGKRKSESRSQPVTTKDAVSETDGVCEAGGVGCNNDHKESSDAGVYKLVEFVASAKTRLAAIEESACQCVVLCKSLGEFFGEDVSGDGTQSSAHILKTLVQFLDLLAEAKKAEGLS